MKRFFITGFCLLLLFACGKPESTLVSESGWENIGGNSEGMTLYIDRATIRRHGDIAEMQHLYDFKTAETIDNSNKAYLSIKGNDEYNCKENQSRMLASSFHSENMGKGEALFSESNPGPWAAIASGSVDEALFKIACAK